MKKLKFFILGAVRSGNTKDLEREIRKAGHTVKSAEPSSLVFVSEGNKFRAMSGRTDLLKFDIFLMRGYNASVTEARILAELAQRQGKTVLDSVLSSRFIPSKVYETSRLSDAGIRHPATFQVMSKDSLKAIEGKLKFPIIVKPIYGQKGQGIKKVGSRSALRKFISENQRGYLIQEYLPIKSDLRVTVVGNKTVGSIRRHVLKGDFRSNTSLGARAEAAKTTKIVSKIARMATKAMEYDTAGVDIAEVGNKLYVLEVNSTPQWQNVKRLLGVNPAEEIIKYAIKKHGKA